jgi:peptidoglycan/xylan/chitin deacetylase (PgdA/CDA1 family)/predicted phosphodiesterase
VTTQLALLADVHANLEALNAVLRDLVQRAPDAQLVCAGDSLGYGPDPDACLEVLAEKNAILVRGNHEEMVLGQRDFGQCVHAGIVAAVWTREKLSGSSLELLEQLPLWTEPARGVVVCHGDLRDAGTYVSDRSRAVAALGQMHELRPEARLLVCGHTHQAMFFTEATGTVHAESDLELLLPDTGSCLINPGAVGQARDSRPIARYALLDLERRIVRYFGVAYDHPATLQKLRRTGLVARVVMPPPRGVAAFVENLKTRRARHWAKKLPSRTPSGWPRQIVVEAKPGLRKSQPPAANTASMPPFGPRVTFPRPKVRRTVLRVGQHALYLSGAGAAFVRARKPGGAIILVYHSVVSQADARWVDPRFSVPEAAFEAQMRFLSRYRHVLALSELLDILSRGDSPAPGSVVITFDDGYKSTLDVAAPILKAHRLPAVVYLPTGYVSRGESQFIDVLYALFNCRTWHGLDLEEDGLSPVTLRDPITVQRTYLALERVLQVSSRERRQALLAEIAIQLRPSQSPPRLTMTWEEVGQLYHRYPNIAIGAHTRDHLDLTGCDSRTLLEEIRGSVGDVRRELGGTPEHFSFPYGRSNAFARAAVRQALLRSAVVTEPARLVRAGADELALPRLGAPRGMSLFPLFTSGAYPDLSLALLGRA